MKKIALLLTLAVVYCVCAHASKVDTIVLRSDIMQKDIKCVVVLPANYEKEKNRRFPVVYLLHGYGDNYAGWVKKAPHTAESADMAQCIIVCPDGAIGSWYFDSPIDPTFKYETYVSKEVPHYVDEHYRTISDRNARAIAGLSMGGHGAMFLAIKHPDVFGAAVSMSGGVDYTPFPNNWDIAKRLGSYSENKERWEANTAYSLVMQLKNNELAISFECGMSDFFIDVNRKLHQRLLDLKIDHDYTERPGVHNWAYWDNAIQFQMIFIKHFFAKTTKNS
ncbi:MAG: XynC protein [Pseudopedobacter saltans]|uniref:XynC protein n=1 Tax=Pseudopedobacter saltans TaxID=151895 RepID=A0A2W5F8F3_9SPHI|nr:MAG: XynC protein [Pseudopedobacter saltans]